MTEQDFYDIVNNVLIEKKLKPFPYFFYDEIGNKEYIFFIEYCGTEISRGEEVIHFAFVLGDLRFGYAPINKEKNCKVDSFYCKLGEVQKTVSEKIEFYKDKCFFENLSFEDVKLDLYLEFLNKLEANKIELDKNTLQFVKREILNSFELGKEKGKKFIIRSISETGIQNGSRDFTEYMKVSE